MYSWNSKMYCLQYYFEARGRWEMINNLCIFNDLTSCKTDLVEEPFYKATVVGPLNAISWYLKTGLCWEAIKRWKILLTSHLAICFKIHNNQHVRSMIPSKKEMTALNNTTNVVTIITENCIPLHLQQNAFLYKKNCKFTVFVSFFFFGLQISTPGIIW